MNKRELTKLIKSLQRDNLSEHENLFLKSKTLNFFDFSNINLKNCSFSNCNFMSCDFSYSNLQNCHFYDCNLQNSNFINCDVCGTKFTNCNFYNATLLGIKNFDVNCSSKLQVCPEVGQFTAFKKAFKWGSNCIVELIIPEHAKRSSATTRKCRTSEALVVKIEDDYGREINLCHSLYDYKFFTEPDTP